MKIFFLDLDGTIEDSRTDMTWCANKTREEFKLEPWTNELIMPHVNRGMRELYTNCFSDLISKRTSHLTGAAKLNAEEFCIAEIQLAYERIYLDNVVSETKLYPDMKEVLAELSKLGKLAVITNKPEKISLALLNTLEVLPYISVVVGGDTCAENKPSTVPLSFAMERLKLTNSETLEKIKLSSFMIGDSPADIKCGTDFGIRTIWCSYGYALSPGNLPPWSIANTPRDILQIVKVLPC